MHLLTAIKERPLVRLIHATAVRWIADDAPMMGAALAYYTLFSIAPLLLLAVTVTGLIFGPEAARGELEHQLVGYFDESTAKSIQNLLSSIERSRGRSRVAVIIGVAVMLFGASSVFNQLKQSLNKIWKVEERPHSGFMAIVVDRLVAIVMVAVVALLLLSSILVSAVISRISTFTTDVTPYALSPRMLQFIDLSASFSLLSILFAIIFRFMPDIRIGWRSVALGSVVTSVLFAAGKILIGFYIAHGALASAYGAAGSVIVLLIWIYYSAQIFLFGAEFTHVYSRAHHLPAEPIADEEEEE
jgi:membrane protein